MIIRANRIKTIFFIFAFFFLAAASGRAQFGLPRKPAVKGPWMNRTLSPDQRADLVIGQMTLDEKISIVHGQGWGFGPPASRPPSRSLGGAGFIPGIERLGIPDLQLSDAAACGAREGAVLAVGEETASFSETV